MYSANVTCISTHGLFSATALLIHSVSKSFSKKSTSLLFVTAFYPPLLIFTSQPKFSTRPSNIYLPAQTSITILPPAPIFTYRPKPPSRFYLPLLFYLPAKIFNRAVRYPLQNSSRAINDDPSQPTHACHIRCSVL